MWKFLNECVEGTSHRHTGIACQDSSFVSPYHLDGEEALILVCADGAGSSSESQVGSRVACDIAVQQVASFFDSGRGIVDITDEVLRAWMTAVNLALNTEAETRAIAPRELACTLLLAVVGISGAAFAQIGDGAIVVLDTGAYRPIFWPQCGEYQNTTFFITDVNFQKNLQIQSGAPAVEELAMFTDGLQMLALNYASRSAHDPFFTPMFKALRAATDRQDLIIPMRQFLDSRSVNERTDDDKTLILAMWVPSGNETL